MLFRKKIDRACYYCTHGGKVDNNTVICKKCGFVPATHQCRKFRYDPLKRIPRRLRAKDFSQYSEDDFSL